MKEEQFYVIKTGWVGNDFLFWREGRAGYTVDFNKAHRFTLEEAQKAAREHENIFSWNKLKDLTTQVINPETIEGVWDTKIEKS